MLTKKQKITLGTLVVLTAFSWLAWMVWDSADELFSAVENLSLYRIFFGVIAACVMLYISAYTFFLLLNSVSITKLPFRNLLTPYFTSLIVRYLPGKIWGFLYQIHRMSEYAKTRDITESSMLQLVLTTTSSIVILFLIFTYHFYGIYLSISIFAILTLLLYVSIRHSLITKTFNFTLHAILKNKSYSIDRDMTTKQSIQLISILYLEWILFLIAWYTLLPDDIQASDTIIIAGAYAASWILGFLILVAPDGWGVRESSFVGIGTFLGYDPAHMLILGLTARFMFIFADILAVATSILLGNSRQT